MLSWLYSAQFASKLEAKAGTEELGRRRVVGFLGLQPNGYSPLKSNRIPVGVWMTLVLVRMGLGKIEERQRGLRV